MFINGLCNDAGCILEVGFTIGGKSMKKLMAVCLVITLCLANVTPVMAYGMTYKSVFSMGSSGNIVIDGNFTDWSRLPESYVYNWDNSANCWYWGIWYDFNNDGELECYKTPEGTYDNNVRHLVQLHADSDYVYFHISTATIYGSGFNCNDYNFSVNGQNCKFQILYNGSDITDKVALMSPGRYQCTVIHGDGSLSSTAAQGASCVLVVKENKKNTELELKIPLTAFKQQNPSINISNVSTVTWMDPNLSNGLEVVIAGTSTGPVLLAVITVAVTFGSYALYSGRKKYGYI